MPQEIKGKTKFIFTKEELTERLGVGKVIDFGYELGNNLYVTVE